MVRSGLEQQCAGASAERLPPLQPTRKAASRLCGSRSREGPGEQQPLSGQISHLPLWEAGSPSCTGLTGLGKGRLALANGRLSPPCVFLMTQNRVLRGEKTKPCTPLTLPCPAWTGRFLNSAGVSQMPFLVSARDRLFDLYPRHRRPKLQTGLPLPKAVTELEGG